jgi:hypothetical protein
MPPHCSVVELRTEDGLSQKYPLWVDCANISLVLILYYNIGFGTYHLHMDWTSYLVHTSRWYFIWQIDEVWICAQKSSIRAHKIRIWTPSIYPITILYFYLKFTKRIFTSLLGSWPVWAERYLRRCALSLRTQIPNNFWHLGLFTWLI